MLTGCVFDVPFHARITIVKIMLFSILTLTLTLTLYLLCHYYVIFIVNSIFN